MLNTSSEPFKDKFTLCFETFENEMLDMGITDYNEGLERVVEKWSHEYDDIVLRLQIVAILWAAEWRGIDFDDEVVESLRDKLLKPVTVTSLEEEEPRFMRSDYIALLHINHHGRPDILQYKVIMIIGFSSMARCEEMRGITIKDIYNEDGTFIVRLRREDLNDDGIFKYYPLMDYIEDVDTNQIIDEYLDLRLQCFSPEVALFMRPSSKRYGYENRAIGKNQFSKMTCHVAELLGKPNPAAYTLHTIRHSVARILADGGISAKELGIVGGWKRIKTPLEYIRTSVEAKKRRLNGSISPSEEWFLNAYKKAGTVNYLIDYNDYVDVNIINEIMKRSADYRL